MRKIFRGVGATWHAGRVESDSQREQKQPAERGKHSRKTDDSSVFRWTHLDGRSALQGLLRILYESLYPIVFL